MENKMQTLNSTVFHSLKSLFQGFFTNVYNFLIRVNPVYLWFLVIILLIINVYLLISMDKKKYKGEKILSLKEFLKLLPVKICYWQEYGNDFFVHEEVPIILKSSLQGYGIIQFLLTYNQDMQDKFARLQRESQGNFKLLFTALAVEVSVYKNHNSYFMVLNKTNQNQDNLVRAALTDMTGNMTWIEGEGVILYRNELANKYKSLLSTLQYQDNNRIISIDNTLYKYNKYSNQSYTIHMLNEINEFKNFHRDEQNKELIYNFLSFLKEKFVILNRNGKITFISEGLKTLIQLPVAQQIYDISDLLNTMNRALSLPDEINLNNYMENMKNKILKCDATEWEYFSSLDGKVFARTIFPKGSHVMLVFEDVSTQIANEKVYLQNKNIHNIYSNHLEEGILVFDTSGKLLYHNNALLNFINEKFINKKDVFLKNLKCESQNSDNTQCNLYISTSIDQTRNFTLNTNNVEDLTIYIIKEHIKDTNVNTNYDYFNNILQEIDNQWRYLEYVKNKEKDLKSLEQINVIFKSLNKMKVYTSSYIDYYEEPKLLATQVINIMEYMKHFIDKMSFIYNMKNVSLNYTTEPRTISLDVGLFQRAVAYFFEFFYGFFLVNNKKITITVDNNNKFIMCMEVPQKFNYENLSNTRLLYGMQKLFKFLKFDVNFTDEDNSFTIMVTYLLS